MATKNIMTVFVNKQQKQKLVDVFQFPCDIATDKCIHIHLISVNI